MALPLMVHDLRAKSSAAALISSENPMWPVAEFSSVRIQDTLQKPVHNTVQLILRSQISIRSASGLPKFKKFSLRNTSDFSKIAPAARPFQPFQPFHHSTRSARQKILPPKPPSGCPLSQKSAMYAEAHVGSNSWYVRPAGQPGYRD